MSQGVFIRDMLSGIFALPLKYRALGLLQIDHISFING